MSLLRQADYHIKLTDKCWSYRTRCPYCPQRKVGNGLGHATASPREVVVRMGLGKIPKFMPEAWGRCTVVSASKLQYQAFDLSTATVPAVPLNCWKALVQVYLWLTCPFQTTLKTSGSPRAQDHPLLFWRPAGLGGLDRTRPCWLPSGTENVPWQCFVCSSDKMVISEQHKWDSQKFVKALRKYVWF